MSDLNTLPNSWSSTVTVPGTLLNAGTIPGTALTTNAKQKVQMSGPQTIATTGAEEFPFIAAATGTVTNVKFQGKDTLATSNSNYVTFTLTNKGQAGAGTTVMLAATDANTSKATGGTAITAYVPRNLTLTSTAADLAVTSGDLLILTVTATGTLANTITNATAALAVVPTT